MQCNATRCSCCVPLPIAAPASPRLTSPHLTTPSKQFGPTHATSPRPAPRIHGLLPHHANRAKTPPGRNPTLDSPYLLFTPIPLHTHIYLLSYSSITWTQAGPKPSLFHTDYLNAQLLSCRHPSLPFPFQCTPGRSIINN